MSPMYDRLGAVIRIRVRWSLISFKDKVVCTVQYVEYCLSSLYKNNDILERKKKFSSSEVKMDITHTWDIKHFVPAIKLDFLFCQNFDYVSDFVRGTKTETKTDFGSDFVLKTKSNFDFWPFVACVYGGPHWTKLSAFRIWFWQRKFLTLTCNFWLWLAIYDYAPQINWFWPVNVDFRDFNKTSIKAKPSSHPELGSGSRICSYVCLCCAMIYEFAFQLCTLVFAMLISISVDDWHTYISTTQTHCY